MLSRFLLGVLSLLAGVAWATSASAEDVVVDMKGGVPDRAVPLGEPFTISVPVGKNAQEGSTPANHASSRHR